MENLNKKYGLFTAICMVVGIVIGSGIFFKAQDVLEEANGSALDSILAWLISGFIMVIIATTFGVMATKYEKVNGAVDYAEAMCGQKYSYYVGWFMSLIYYPAMTAVLAWVSARYTLIAALGNDEKIFSTECITISLFYLILSFFINTISPRIAGKFQVSSTIVKLLPIAFIAIVGTVIGIINGTLGSNFATSEISGSTGGGLFAAICTTIFAYEGWIVATSINSEMKNAKKDLPIALCIGTLIIVAAYTLYNIGILGLAGGEEIKNGGTNVAFNSLFNGALSPIINVLVVISCLGTLNGLMLGGVRGLYSIAARDQGFAPKIFSQVDKMTGVPHNSAIFSLLMCGCWFFYFIALGAGAFDLGVISKYGFDSSELPIITLYAIYVPILIAMMIKEKDLNPLRRFLLPALSLLGIGVIITACIVKHNVDIIWYLIVFALIMLGGFITQKINEKKIK
jgi:APA family basic amino acid/polyamine antiporter